MKPILKSFYQLKKHYQKRGRWHRVNMVYYRFYGKDNLNDYWEFLRNLN